MKPKIVGIGIATMDIYSHQNRMYPGGNELNIAYHANMQGADSAFMGVFANDKAGAILENTLQQAGVDTKYSHHEIGSSGYAKVELLDGERVFVEVNFNGVTDRFPFDFTQEEIEYIKTYDIACISRGARVSNEKVRMLAKQGAKICYDFYDDFSDKDILEVSPNVEISFLSCSHLLEKETKNMLSKVVRSGCGIVVGTRGGDPTIAYDGRQFYYQEISQVKATDTMGAGDSFISAFLTNYLSVAADNPVSAEDKIKTSLQCAADYAAKVVVMDGSLGVGYDVEPQELSKYFNI